MLPAETLHPVLRCPDAVLGLQLIGDEPVAELRIIGMDSSSSLDEVSVGPDP
jgi:hypothetical protein